MGVGLYLIGRFDPGFDGGSGPSEDRLALITAWFEEHGGEPLEGVRLGEGHEGIPTAFACLHPCAEEVELSMPEPGVLVASAKTSTVGPGYHAHLCGLLHRLGDDLNIAWDGPDDEEGTGDETGYFHTGDRAALEAEMLLWLRSTASVVKEGLEGDYREMMLSMPTGHRYPHHGPLVTPLGPRDLAWLEGVLEDPRRGIDLFPWWDEGLGAGFYLGRALCRMWRDVRWRVPLGEEADLLEEVHLDLARAFEHDSSLAYPWREWAELMDTIEARWGYIEMAGVDVEPEVRRRAATCPDGPLIGYRRRPVRVDLTRGWSVEVPGAMDEAWEGDGTWCGWDGGRTIWFNSYAFTRPDGTPPTAPEALEGLTLPEGERIEHRGERVIGVAVFAPHEEDGKALWQLSGRSAVAGGLGVCNVFVEDPGERDWAVAVWRSLDHA